jgi:hypothetical protein
VVGSGLAVVRIGKWARLIHRAAGALAR